MTSILSLHLLLGCDAIEFGRCLRHFVGMSTQFYQTTWHPTLEDSVLQWQINSHSVFTICKYESHYKTSFQILLQRLCYQTHNSRFTMENNYLSTVCKKKADIHKCCYALYLNLDTTTASARIVSLSVRCQTLI
jgi:hypothetical protein